MVSRNLGSQTHGNWISRLLCLAIVFSFVLAGTVAAIDPVMTAPVKNAQGQYEVSSPANLMYMSKNMGKPEVPRDGTYVMTNDIDMAGIEGFVPMCTDKDRTFWGTFDGRNHIIKNLTINQPGRKYCSFFGYIGDEYHPTFIKNLGMVNVSVTGTQYVAGIVGVSYGVIENCFASGKLYDDGGSSAGSDGGILGSNKDGEGTVQGLVKNCYAVVDLSGTQNIGGIAGLEDAGGVIENCYAAGTLIARGSNGSVGGVVGAFNGGQRVMNNAVLISKMTGKINTDKIVGQLNDESGRTIAGNIAWEGSAILGNEPVEQPVKWADKTSKELRSKATYVALGWDFNKVWAWKGAVDNGYPILKAFSEKDQVYKFDWSIDTVIVSKPVNMAKAKVDVNISARVISSNQVGSVEIYYGDSEDGSLFTNKVAMKKIAGDRYTGNIPATSKAFLYYYIKATCKNNTVTKPYDSKKSIKILIDDGSIKGDPNEVDISLGEVQSTISFNWTTVPQIKDSVVQYAKKEGFTGKYSEIKGISYLAALSPGFKEKTSHKVTINGLEPSTVYVYRVGDGKNFMSPQYEFKSAPAVNDTKEFTFLFGADSQSISVKDYNTFKDVFDYALTQVPNPAFLALAGDISENGYKTSEWANFYESLSTRLTNYPWMPAVGNHELKGDSKYLMFKSKFNLPANGPAGDLNGTVYSFEYGEAFFAVLNTEALPLSTLAPNLDKQFNWLEAQLKKTTKKWKIVLLHEGAYSSSHDPALIRSLTAARFDKLQIDLVLSGHDHIYLRTTMKGDQKVKPGEGTTYLQGGTVGNKFYKLTKERSDRYTEVASDSSLQVINFITVSKDKITVKAMQKAAPGSKEYKQLDYFELINPLAKDKQGPVTQKNPETIKPAA